MVAVFYECLDNPLKLNKTLNSNNSATKIIKLLKVCGVIDLQITLNDYAFTHNYVYIPFFGRYYFITNIEIQNNGLYILTLKEDVLYTYKTDIIQNNNHVIKSSLPIGNNIDYVKKFEKTILTQNMDNPFLEHISDVLITIRG